MRPVTKSPIDVSAAVAEIEANPKLWNQYVLRTKGYETPHSRIDDIWVRYRDFAEYNPKRPRDFLKQHHSVWYPSYDKLPTLAPLIFGLMNIFQGEELGGVLITRIPAGCSVGRHKDIGWHAEFFNRKFAVMLKSNAKQAFCFEGEQMYTEPGEVFEFDNKFEHWVLNQSDADRMTMIVCIRTTVPPQKEVQAS